MMEIPLDSPPHHPDGDLLCFTCHRSVFNLYDGKCAVCAGVPVVAGPVEWTPIVGGGEYRIRQSPWEGEGISPVYEYRQPVDYDYPEMVVETRADEESLVRTVALPQMNKYGQCYEIVYINEKRKMRKQLFFVHNKLQAIGGAHDAAVGYVKKKKGIK